MDPHDASGMSHVANNAQQAGPANTCPEHVTDAPQLLRTLKGSKVPETYASHPVTGKRFISRRLPTTQLTSAPSYPSTRLMRPVTSTSVGDPLVNRSVSLPMTLSEPRYSRLPHVHGHPALTAAVHSNRVVSVPEATMPSVQSKSLLYSQGPILPTVDELHPLIDLSSPPHKGSHMDLSMAVGGSPTSSVLIHSSFSKSSDGFSPPSSPEFSEAEIIVGSPTTGRSEGFLRGVRHAPSTSIEHPIKPNPIETNVLDFAKLSSSKLHSEAVISSILTLVLFT